MKKIFNCERSAFAIQFGTVSSSYSDSEYQLYLPSEKQLLTELKRELENLETNEE
ncbi:MAG: hypothetical protein LBV75_00975 [Paludibacter sp.]|nr:hypothetical protein [Paludibacter sp.]